MPDRRTAISADQAEAAHLDLRRSHVCAELTAGGWLSFLVWCVVFAVGAFWELIEWWTTLIVASDVGQAFLGSQGDIWDAQWDMFLVGVGAAIALAAFQRLHDRSMATSTR